MPKGTGVTLLRRKYHALAPYLNEQTRRLWAANEARAWGRGGITRLAVVTGLSRTTLYTGLRELTQKPRPQPEEVGRQRRAGGGRKKVTAIAPSLLRDLEWLLEPVTRGDPQSPLRWTCKSTTRLAEELRRMSHQVSQRTVCTLLGELGYSLQANRKTHEGARHPDRNAQFLHLAETVQQFQARGQPVISVDAKKKELIGEFKNSGREWQRKGQPHHVNVHDFADPQLGKVAPYGVYDIGANQGGVSVGIDHDTAQFAVESIRRWWYELGKALYPQATALLITADCGGSNGHRVRLWKLELQQLADELGITVHVCHFPPGTSKWNKIEHRMFCHISQHWRGRPLTSREVVVNLISHTTTSKGLKIRAALDQNRYPTGIEVSEKDFQRIAIERADFHGEWNYQIKLRQAQ